MKKAIVISMILGLTCALGSCQSKAKKVDCDTWKEPTAPLRARVWISDSEQVVYGRDFHVSKVRNDLYAVRYGQVIKDGKVEYEQYEYKVDRIDIDTKADHDKKCNE